MQCAISWSGGKDAYLSLLRARESGHLVSDAVTTFVGGRSSGHGISESLLYEQCQALSLRLHAVHFDLAPQNSEYESSVRCAFERLREQLGCEGIIFGDLFLKDIRTYRERALVPPKCCALFPLWGENTANLAQFICNSGVCAVITCVNLDMLSPEIVGKTIDLPLLQSLPPEVDPCGEQGEFHTFVSCGPGFTKQIPLCILDYRTEGTFRFAELGRIG